MFKTVPYFIGCKISFHGFYNIEARDNFCKRLIFVYVLVSIHGDHVRTSSQNYLTFFFVSFNGCLPLLTYLHGKS